MEFTITAKNGDSVKIEAENWMVAMGKALTFFGADIRELGRIVCSPGSDNSVFIDNPERDNTWMVRAIQPKITVVAAAASTNLAEEPIEPGYSEPKSLEEDPVATAELAAAPPPTLQMPVTSSLRKEVEEIESLAERLFDLSMELSSETPDNACQMALELIHEFVAVEAACVARGSINDPVLRFVAATGPVADKFKGMTLQFGEGLVGMCFDMGGTLMVADVQNDDRHHVAFDEATGFETRSMLCVPILDEEGQSFGVIQLLNPEGGSFDDMAVEAVETISRTLAGSLAQSLA